MSFLEQSRLLGKLESARHIHFYLEERKRLYLEGKEVRAQSGLRAPLWEGLHFYGTQSAEQ